MSGRQEQTLTEYNPGEMSLKLQELILQGWRIDPDRPLTLLGYMWEIGMVRDATDEQLASDAAEAAKPSRAEILARARAAKAEKAKEVEKKLDGIAEVINSLPEESASE